MNKKTPAPNKNRQIKNADAFMLSPSDIEFLNNEAVNIYDNAINFEVQQSRNASKNQQKAAYTQDFDRQQPEQKFVYPAETEPYEVRQQYISPEEQSEEFRFPESFYQHPDDESLSPSEHIPYTPHDTEAFIPIEAEASSKTGNKSEEERVYAAETRRIPVVSPFISEAYMPQQHATTDLFSGSRAEKSVTSFDDVVKDLVIEEPLCSEGDLFFHLKHRCQNEFSVTRRLLKQALKRNGWENGYKRFRAFMTG